MLPDFNAIVRKIDGLAPIHKMSDFPDDVAGVITLLSDNEERIRAKGLSTANKFAVPDAVTNNFQAEAFNVHTLTYTGAATLFTGGAVGFLQFFKLTMFGSASPFVQGSGTFFDVVGDAVLAAKQVALIESRIDNFASLGTVEDIRLFANSTALLNNGGLTLCNSDDLRMIEIIMFNFAENTNDVFLTIDGDQDLTGKISGLTATTFASESVFDFRPNIGENSSFTIEGSTFLGSGVAFKQGVTGNITVIADASIGSTSITSVEDSPTTPGIARFNYTGAAVYKFQKVSIIDFVSNTAYNITGILTKVGAGFFEISKIAWGSDEGVGTFTSSSILCTSVAHGRTDGEGVKVRDSVRHDGNTYLYNAGADPDEFQVNIPFDTGTETATWDTGSLTQEDKQIVSVAGNVGIPQSRTILSISVQGNTTETDFTGVTPGDFIDMDFTSSPATLLPSTSLFRLIDPITGKSQYIGSEVDFPFALHMPVSGEKASGVSREFLFGVQINDDAVIGFIGREFASSMGSATVVKDSILQPGDFLTPKIANNINQENFIVRHLQGSGR